MDICFRHEGLFSEATFKDIAQLETVNNNSVVVQLTDDVVGSMSARHLREGKNLGKNVKKKFPVGSAHPCHVVGLDVDRLAEWPSAAPPVCSHEDWRS